ncbi:MAG: MTAP family purine nucleoside phosphorylase [bacterium]|nr:MTAP family purine nucleoside phosphorylase [bacterium]
MIGIIGGTLFSEAPIFAGAKIECHEGKHGKAFFMRSEKAIFINRHGFGKDTPPHMINHAANMEAFRDLGVSYVIGACSVGSMKPEIPLGSIVIPDDYINLWGITSIFNREIRHVAPRLSEKLTGILADESLKRGKKPICSGVYFQSSGPRFETKAEIRMMSQFSDIVGMTMGQEADAAAEAGIEYAAICSADNYANGIKGSDVTESEVRRMAGENAASIRDIIFGAMERI